MKRTLAFVFALICSTAVTAAADTKLKANLLGREEVPPLFTAGKGTFTATIVDGADLINWQINFSQTTGNITQAHLHFGQAGVNGGIMVFLCTNLGNGPVGTQTCPSAGGSISGSLSPADIVGPTSQGMTVGNFFALTKALRQGTSYVNVHSDLFPGGEIRGQIKVTP